MATASINCEACEALRQEVPELVCNGFDDDMCSALSNDSGLSASSGHNDCTDLNNLNDCLIGNEAEEVELFEVCDWKPFMKDFINNLWTVLKAMICAICGIWTNIHNLWAKIAEILNQIGDIINNIDTLFCYVNNMNKGATFSIGEDPTGNSYVVAGKGISFYQAVPGEAHHTTDIAMMYVAGGLMTGWGSLIWHTSDFTDARACVNFDNGSVERTSTSRLGNPYWGRTGRPANNGELLYEIRLRLAAYPQIGTLFNGFGLETGGSAYRVEAHVFYPGNYAWGQHGGCNTQTGVPDQSGYSSGHLVPDGWLYVQVRMTYADMVHNDGSQYTPRYYMGARMNIDKFDC